MSNEALEYWLHAINKKQVAVLATVLPSEVARNHQLQSKRLFINEQEQVGDLGNAEIEEQSIEWMLKMCKQSMPKAETREFLMEDGEEISIFFDVFIPPVEIMIFGAGHDAIPLAAYSLSLGYPTTVVDARTAYNNEKLFPGAKRIIAGNADFDHVFISGKTYIIVMNHHIEKDEQTLTFVLKSDAPYVGMLGPHSRRVKMLDRLVQGGVTFGKEELGKLYSPVGLDIGAISPGEIAISILAEIMAVKNGHQAGFLKDAEVIHK